MKKKARSKGKRINGTKVARAKGRRCCAAGERSGRICWRSPEGARAASPEALRSVITAGNPDTCFEAICLSLDIKDAMALLLLQGPAFREELAMRLLATEADRAADLTAAS